MEEINQKTIFDSLNIEVNMQKLDKSRITMKILDNFSAKQVIKNYHYSKTMPTSELNFGFYIDGKLNLVVVFSQGVNRFYQEFITDDNFTNKNLWELVRLFSFDWAGKNMESYCISKCIKYIKKKYKNIKFLISYADPIHNHIGIIYQATNWLYTGLSQPIPIYKDKKTGKMIHNRTFNEHSKKYPDLSLKEVAEKLNIEVIPQPPKHRYIMFICSNKEKKHLMAKLRLKFFVYPKLAREVSRAETLDFQSREAGAIPASRIPKNIKQEEINKVLKRNTGLIDKEGAIQILINQKKTERLKREEELRLKRTEKVIQKMKEEEKQKAL